jgi:uncharacterized protein (TIGR03086 family)
MTMHRAPSTGLARACAGFADLLHLVAEHQWTAPTPCPDWTVRDLVAHVVAGNRNFTAILNGRPPVATADAALAVPGPQLRNRYHAELPGLLAAFDAPGALTEPVELPVGMVPGAVALRARITDVLVHGWDLAHALDVPTTGLPADLAVAMSDFVRGRLGDLPRDRFGPEQPCPADAPPIDRLAAALGRVIGSATGPATAGDGRAPEE